MSDFSVIVPIYHGEKYIAGIISQIEFCMRQLDEGNYIELILVNDAPDSPIDFRWKSEIIDVRIINLYKNKGIHGARLEGLMRSRGEYILFLDQDDRISDEYLKSQLENLGTADAVVCRAIHGKNLRYDIHRPFKKAVGKEFMVCQGNGIVSPGQVLLRKEAISDIWKKNVLMHNGADDWLLWLCMMSEGKTFALNNEILYEHMVEGKNASDNFIEMTHSEYEMLQIFERDNVLSSVELKELKKTVERMCEERIRTMDKLRNMYSIYGAWMRIRYNNCSITSYLKLREYETVAIYGVGYLGKQLYKALKKDQVKVIYFIDRNAASLKEEIAIYKPNEKLPDVDVIVVTLVQDGKEVIKLLEESCSAKLICLEELLLEGINY